MNKSPYFQDIEAIRHIPVLPPSLAERLFKSEKKARETPYQAIIRDFWESGAEVAIFSFSKPSTYDRPNGFRQSLYRQVCFVGLGDDIAVMQRDKEVYMVRRSALPRYGINESLDGRALWRCKG